MANNFDSGNQIILQSFTLETGLSTILVGDPSTGELTMAATVAEAGSNGYWLVADANTSVTYNGQTIAGIYLISLSATAGATRFLNGDTSSSLCTLIDAPSSSVPAVWFPIPTSMGGYCLAAYPGPETTSAAVWMTNNNNPGPGPNLSLWSVSNQGSGVRNSWWQPLTVHYSAS